MDLHRARALAKRGLTGVILADMNEDLAQKSAASLEIETGCRSYAFPGKRGITGKH